MAKTKQKKLENTFSQFMNACVSDQSLAGRMLQENPSRLTDTVSIGETAFAYFVIENYLDAARFLLEMGADINTRDSLDRTPLIDASSLGHQQMVRLLLEHGADVNAKDFVQDTALFKAAQYGYIEVCEALLAAGAEMQGHNFMEQYLADVALPRKRTKLLSLLTRYGYREAEASAT